MSHERQRRLMELLDGALELPENERFAYLDRRCADDPDLRDEVCGLLETRAGDDSLDRPAFSLHAEGRVDRRIGPYRVVRLLERGGMGSVYLAERSDFEKQVALKIIRRGLDLDDVLVRRFHNERQILARLEHPHIARLLDGGTTDDHVPYLVMEYVDGEPVDRYCRSRNLSVEARLELFAKICRAVQHAHRNLVVHRDLKPANILIDGHGEPRLLDFGIAKLLDDDLADKTVVTGTREGLMTPRYAAPEQIRGEPITTAVDVYSLGVLLFELLTGFGPYRLDTTRGDELARAICDQEIERPSTAVRRRRGNDPRSDPESEIETRRLGRRLKGDLDHIVLKALHKRPEDRYGSVQELADDLERHRDGLPVAAATGAWTYRARKFVRRHWLAVGVLLGFVLVSLAFGSVYYREFQRAETALEEKDAALEEKEAALGEKEEVVDFLQDLFRQAGPSAGAGRELTAVDLLIKGREQIENSGFDDETKVELFTTLGNLLRNVRKREDARLAFRDALALAREAYADTHDEVLTCRANLASVDFDEGRFDEYEREMRDILRIRQESGDGPADIWKVMTNVANVLTIQGDFEEAEKLYDEVYKGRRERYGEDHRNVAVSLRRLAGLYATWGRSEEALDHIQKALEIEIVEARDKEDSSLASTLDLLGRLEMDAGNLAEAEDRLSRAREIREGLAGRPGIERSLQNLAQLALKQGELDRAEALLEEASSASEGYPEDHWVLAHARGLRGALLAARGDEEAARELLRTAYERLLEVRGPRASVTGEAEARLRALDAGAVQGAQGEASTTEESSASTR